ncbi:MAG: hypothetical protein LQ345_001559 [Seirophora villosa]|nr:MAG: hypothetical protein LQ345_001559 [Seirophora villosa]
MASSETPITKHVRFAESPEPVGDAIARGTSEDPSALSSCDNSPEIPHPTATTNDQSGRGEDNGEGSSTLPVRTTDESGQDSSPEEVDTSGSGHASQELPSSTPGNAQSGRGKDERPSSFAPTAQGNKQRSSRGRINTSSAGHSTRSSSSSILKEPRPTRSKGKEREKRREDVEDNRADGSDSFPICIHHKEPIFMMADANWSLVEFQEAILRSLNAHQIYTHELEAEWFGKLTVVWESNARMHYDNLGFPNTTLLGDHNIRAVLEFLKRRMRSDFVLADEAY